MSQDQPPQPPTKPETQTPAPKSARGHSGSPLQQVSQTLRQTWSRAQPVLRSQSIKLLRATIRVLEGLLAKLEAPDTTATGVPTSEPSAMAESSESPVAPVAPSTPASGSADQPAPASESILDQLRPRLEQLQGWWNVALGRIRSWLPESLSQKLSDQALTGVTAGTLVILLWITSALLPGPPQTANVPPSQRNLPTTDLTTPAELNAPEASQPLEVSPPPPATIFSGTGRLSAGNRSLESVATPSPALELSPEQQLITTMQTQVTEIGNQYADCLVQSVQADFQGSRLILKASDGWYELNPSQQDELAGELLNQAQKADLRKLEIIDSQSTLLARSPVVGTDIVILKRQTALPALTAS